MAAYKLGLKTPTNFDADADVIEARDNEDTGMMSNVTRDTDGHAFIVETWNDAVGLTTYWHADTLEDGIEVAERVTGIIE